LWCFRGEIVVNCVVNVVTKHHVFAFRKTRHVFKVYFLSLPTLGRLGNVFDDGKDYSAASSAREAQEGSRKGIRALLAYA